MEYTRAVMSAWFVYIIRRSDGALYTGISVDPERRRSEHERGGGGAARSLRGRGPLELVFRCVAGDRRRALSLERQIKLLPRSRKLALLETVPDGDCERLSAFLASRDERVEGDVP